MDRLLRFLDRLLGQDVALRNAAQATARLMHDRRRREAVDAFLEPHLGGDAPAPPPLTEDGQDRAGG
jgi:hypothetical protein